MLRKIGLIRRTIINLKPIQVFNQIRLRFQSHRPLSDFSNERKFTIEKLLLPKYPITKKAKEDQTFTFLNLSKSFPGSIDWNYMGHGKLWNYNLQYLEYINDASLPLEKRIIWIEDIYHQLWSGALKLEPYPASLRIMNMIRFMSENSLPAAVEKQFNNYLYTELTYLHSHYEFHILGNHLLENAFAMLMGSKYFKATIWDKTATKILEAQLNEQILSDGAHFELSTMYHQIIFYRLLEAFSYVEPQHKLKPLLKMKLEDMFGWLAQMSFSNGDIPHFNDSADGITFTSPQLFGFAEKLGLKATEKTMLASGYRKFSGHNHELIIDVHGISPKYQPGHAHADHGSFVLYNNGLPLVVDPGTSTYNISPRRQWERSSSAHNTITIDDHDLSEVWSGFRVGRRAVVAVSDESAAHVNMNINYKLKNNLIKHQRALRSVANEIIIEDRINSEKLACARFHLAPGIQPTRIENQVRLGDVKLTFGNNERITFKDYNFAKEFNLLETAKVVEVFFKGHLLTKIKFNV